MRKKFRVKFKLIDDWKNSWRYISLWCFAIITAATSTWDILPTAWQEFILSNYSSGSLLKIINMLAVIGFFGRLIKIVKGADVGISKDS